MTEDRKRIFCLGFLREYFCLWESKTRILISNSDYFKGVVDAFKVRRITDVCRTRVRRYTPHNRENHDVRQPGETRLVSFGPGGEVRRLPQPHNNFFCFSTCLLSALAWPCHSCQLNSSSSTSNFRLTAVASLPCCLHPLHLSMTRIWSWGLRVFAII